jgi:hypothetical protein
MHSSSRRIGIILLALLLFASASCTTDWKSKPGQCADCRDALQTNLLAGMSGPSWSDVPLDVRHRLVACYTDLALANITPAQLRQLDAGARGEATVPAALSAQVDRQLKDGVGRRQKGDFTPLEPFCPNDIPTFQKYVRW